MYQVDRKNIHKGLLMCDQVKYLAIETAACFNFAPLIRRIKDELKNKNPGMSHEDFTALMYKNLGQFSINGQKFEYQHQNNHLGGARWFVKCPECGKPSFKLYLPRKETKRKQLYLCKVCHRLKNASSLMGASKKYKKVVKPLKALEKIKKSLLKKGITPDKAAPLLDAYDRIEKELNNSPEYRLWKFQQKHKSSN